MNKFKVGDKVYYPSQGTQIFQLESSRSLEYPVGIAYYADGYNRFDTFTPKGIEYRKHKTPQIFHATAEEKAKLEAFYGVEFEAPPVKPTSHEIIQAKLDKGIKAVPCWVSNTNQQPTSRENYWAFIKKVTGGHTPYVDKDGYGWIFATPFDPDKCEAITELPK